LNGIHNKKKDMQKNKDKINEKRRDASEQVKNHKMKKEMIGTCKYREYKA